MRYILHHGDADGICAAAIAVKEAECAGKDPVKLFTMEYGAGLSAVDLSGFVIGRDECWLLDFSLSPADMRRLLELTGDNLIWIDHHVTAISALQDFAHVKGVRNTQRAACLLTWDFCAMGYPAPLAVRLIGDRDTWTMEYGETSKYFHESFWRWGTPDATKPVWGIWLKAGYKCDVEIAQGKELFEQKQRRLKGVIQRLGWSEKLHGSDQTFLNVNYEGSGDLADAALSLGHAVLHAYIDMPLNGSLSLVRKHSLYSATVDVGALAKERGGGGHRNAAGWTEKI